MKKTSAVEVSIQAVSPALMCITTSRAALLQVPGRPQVTADPADHGAAEPTIGEFSFLLQDQRPAGRTSPYLAIADARARWSEGFSLTEAARSARPGSARPGRSGEADDLRRSDGPPDDGLKLAGPDLVQVVLEVRGAGAVDVEAPYGAPPVRVPSAASGRAVHPD